MTAGKRLNVKEEETKRQALDIAHERGGFVGFVSYYPPRLQVFIFWF